LIQEFTSNGKKEVNNLNQMGWLARNGHTMNQEEIYTKMIAQLSKLFLPQLKEIASKPPLFKLPPAPKLPNGLEYFDTRIELLEAKLKKFEENQGETVRPSPTRTPTQFRI